MDRKAWDPESPALRRRTNLLSSETAVNEWNTFSIAVSENSTTGPVECGGSKVPSSEHTGGYKLKKTHSRTATLRMPSTGWPPVMATASL